MDSLQSIEQVELESTNSEKKMIQQADTMKKQQKGKQQTVLSGYYPGILAN